MTKPPGPKEQRVYENPVFSDKATFLKTSKETGGSYSLIKVEVAPGGGNNLHTHLDYTETFTVVEGPLTVQVGKEHKVLQRGESATVPARTPHLFRNPTNKTVSFHVELRPGQPGFEQSVQIGYGLAKDGLTNSKGIPNKFSHLALLVVNSGSSPVGMLAFLLPVMRWAASRAKKRGVEKELIEKYCR